MSNAEEATNDFCTRCFKYDRCTKVQSGCTMADSYQEGYEDGYHQAEKDNELTWEDMECIIKHYQDIMAEKSRVFVRAEDYQELLKRFNQKKGKKNDDDEQQNNDKNEA